MTEHEMLHVVGLYVAEVSTEMLCSEAGHFIRNVCAKPPEDHNTHIIPALQESDPSLFFNGSGVTYNHIKQYADKQMDTDTAILFMERVVDFGQSVHLLDYCITLNLDMQNVRSFQEQLQLLLSPQRKAAAAFMVHNRKQIEERDAMMSMVERIGELLTKHEEEAEDEAPQPAAKPEFVNYVPASKARH